MEELKKCPFCGGEARLEQIPSATWDKFVVTCESPKCCACYIGYCDEGLYDTKEKAIAAWNTRKPMERIVERLDSECKKHCDATKTYLGSDENDLGLRHLGKANAFSKAIEIVKEEM